MCAGGDKAKGGGATAVRVGFIVYFGTVIQHDFRESNDVCGLLLAEFLNAVGCVVMQQRCIVGALRTPADQVWIIAQ